MLGLDSMSRLTFMRKLPQTFAFLTQQLGAVVLQGELMLQKVAGLLSTVGWIDRSMVDSRK